MSLRQLIVEVASALGISTLKSQQSEAIFQFLHGRDVFVALPTGYGKSLCYMALPWIFDRLRGVTNQSVVLVVSPLVALMADQVAQCCSCAVARYVMLCQCGCRLRNQTFLGNKHFPRPEEAGHGVYGIIAFQSTECMGKAVRFSAQFHQGASNRIWRNSRTL